MASLQDISQPSSAKLVSTGSILYSTAVFVYNIYITNIDVAIPDAPIASNKLSTGFDCFVRLADWGIPLKAKHCRVPPVFRHHQALERIGLPLSQTRLANSGLL